MAEFVGKSLALMLLAVGVAAYPGRIAPRDLHASPQQFSSAAVGPHDHAASSQSRPLPWTSSLDEDSDLADALAGHAAPSPLALPPDWNAARRILALEPRCPTATSLLSQHVLLQI